jgi:hypothetical protein
MPAIGFKICRPSPIYDDWVLKGFHLHIESVELAVRPGHKKGMIVFKPVFRSDEWNDVDAAVRLVIQNCLSSTTVREKWIPTLGRAMIFLNGYNGELPELANGRKYEFRRLQKALLNYSED